MATVGAATAQVTMSGTVGFRFQSTVSDAGAQDKGVGVSDSAISLATSEDLGGGMKLSASTGFENTYKAGTVTGTGLVIALSTANMGSVSFSTSESGDYLPIDAITTMANGTTGDRIAYTSPSFSGFTVGAVYNDGTAGAGAHSTTNSNTLFQVSYAAGPLTANYGKLNLKAENTVYNSLNRMSVSYDLGVAKVTYGQVSAKSAADVKAKETGLSISAPIASNITVGAQMASSKTGTDAKLKGTNFTASYALSKRTSIALQVKRWDSATAGVSPKDDRLTLVHSF